MLKRTKNLQPYLSFLGGREVLERPRKRWPLPDRPVFLRSILPMAPSLLRRTFDRGKPLEWKRNELCRTLPFWMDCPLIVTAFIAKSNRHPLWGLLQKRRVHSTKKTANEKPPGGGFVQRRFYSSLGSSAGASSFCSSALACSACISFRIWARASARACSRSASSSSLEITRGFLTA